MSSQTDDEWTVLSPTPLLPSNMDTATYELPKADEALPHECTINTKPTVDENKHHDDCTCDRKPVLVRKDSIESIDEDYRPPRRAARPIPPHRYTPSPHYIPPVSYYESRSLNSATQLLEKVGKEDGIINLAVPLIRSVYIATYPFGDKDVKKWSWLMAAGIEEEYLVETSRNADYNGDNVLGVERVRHRRNEFPTYDVGNTEIPSVYLSRALDVEVIPEDSQLNVRYLVITQNRHRPAGAKLLVAESRKAAGVMMFYETLKGDSIVFVGATVHQCKVVHSKNFKKVASLEEAVQVQDVGFVGVVC